MQSRKLSKDRNFTLREEIYRPVECNLSPRLKYPVVFSAGDSCRAFYHAQDAYLFLSVAGAIVHPLEIRCGIRWESWVDSSGSLTQTAPDGPAY